MICSISEINVIDVLKKYKVQKKGRGQKKHIEYLDCICAFDIETSTLYALQLNYMYIWQFQIGHEYTVIGRRWSEFKTMIGQICEYLDDVSLVVYVHNLSYEFQYLKGVLDFGEEDVFATSVRRIIKCRHRNIEFRCSMMLSNMSLKQFTHTMHVEHEKLDAIDYEHEYFPWSDLPEDVLQYSAYDVIGLVEAVEQKMRLDGDNLYTIPLTSTGYPRRDMKAAMRFYPHQKLKDMLPDLETLYMLYDAFRGGNTHANRHYAGKILEGMKSADESSAYPYAMCNCLYPMSAFIDEESSRERLHDLILDNDRALLMQVTFHDIFLKDEWNGAPYISRDKCQAVIHGIYDNGRVLEAERVTLTMTDIDFQIIIQDYSWTEMDVHKLKSAEYGLLPQPFRHVIISYYEKKTKLKGDPAKDMEYNKSKSLLNGLYGMMAMKPIRKKLIFKDGVMKEDTSISDEELLAVAYGKPYTSYAWGVWVTAWSRYMLQEGINTVGPDNFVYCDTDSVKYLDSPLISWDDLNRKRKQDAVYAGAVAEDVSGKVHYMGVFEPDGEYKRFITLGAKRYAYEDDQGLHITISGVSKKAGARELEKLENMKPGFMFQKSGKTASRYVDEPYTDIFWMKDDNGKQNYIEVTPYILIEETTYLMSLTDEYMDLIGILEH